MQQSLSSLSSKCPAVKADCISICIQQSILHMLYTSLYVLLYTKGVGGCELVMLYAMLLPTAKVRCEDVCKHT